jgi:hypothetical protein
MSENTETVPEPPSEGPTIWAGPSYYVNRSWVVTFNQMVRLAFCEQGNPGDPIGPTTFRTAVTLTPWDAVALADALETQLKPIRVLLAQMSQVAEGQKGAEEMPETKE